MNKFLARLKNAHKSRTVVLACVTMILGVAETIIPETSLSWRIQAPLLVVLGLAGIILRFDTSNDLADKS